MAPAITVCLPTSGEAASSARRGLPWAPVPTSAVAAAAIPAAEPAFAGRRGTCQRSRHHLGVDVLLDRLALGGQLLDRGLSAQVEPALAVDLDRLHHDLVADVAHLFDALHPMVGELRDVDQAVLAGTHLDESSERHDAHDLALVDLAHVDLVGEALDLVDRLLPAFLVDRGDEDAAVVLDVDLGSGLLGDLADHRAA